MSHAQAIGIIVLAAGASVRLGEPKQLLKCSGKTLLRRAVETALASVCRPVVVVLGANVEKIKSEIEGLSLEIVLADDWASGMSASIHAGLKKLLKVEPALSAVVLMLCDQPFVTTETIERLIEAHEKTKMPIIACEYENTIGAPALFARALFGELLNLQGEAGAKAVIKKHEKEIAKIIAPEAAFDVDTPEDQLRLQNYELRLRLFNS